MLKGDSTAYISYLQERRYLPLVPHSGTRGGGMEGPGMGDGGEGGGRGRRACILLGRWIEDI